MNGEVGGAEGGYAEHFLDFQQESVDGHGRGECADHAGAGVGPEGAEDAAVAEAQLFAEGAVDAPRQVVEVGVGGVDGDAVADEADGGAAGLGAVGDALEAGEDEGVVGDDEVGAQGDGFVDDGGGEVEGYEDAAAGLLAVAEEEAGVVVVFLQLGAEGGVEPRDDLCYFLCFHNSWITRKRGFYCPQFF